MLSTCENYYYPASHSLLIVNERRHKIARFGPCNNTADSILILSHWMVNNIIQQLKITVPSLCWPQPSNLQNEVKIKLLMEVSQFQQELSRYCWAMLQDAVKPPKDPLLKAEVGAESTLGLHRVTISHYFPWYSLCTFLHLTRRLLPCPGQNLRCQGHFDHWDVAPRTKRLTDQ